MFHEGFKSISARSDAGYVYVDVVGRFVRRGVRLPSSYDSYLTHHVKQTWNDTIPVLKRMVKMDFFFFFHYYYTDATVDAKKSRSGHRRRRVVFQQHTRRFVHDDQMDLEGCVRRLVGHQIKSDVAQ